MTHTYKELFEIMPVPEPPKDLFARITVRVEQAEISRQKKRALTYGTISVISFLGGASALVYVVERIANSDIPTYISLMFSDGAAMNSWKELVLSISDVMPVSEITIALGVVLLCVYSISSVSRARYSLRHFISKRTFA